MSDIDFPINLPPIPKPKVSPDEGIPSIPSAKVGQVAVSGASGTNEVVVPLGENAQQGQSGYIFRQFSGTMTVADPNGNATVAEFRTGIQNIYSNLPSSYSGSARYGDIVTLVNATGGAFQGRFLVVLQNDNAPNEATIQFTANSKTWYALNISSTSVAGITDAIDQFFSIAATDETANAFDLITELEEATGGFSISVDGNYSTDAEGFITPNNSVNIAVKAGTVKYNDNISINASGDSQSEGFGADRTKRTIVIYLEYTVNISSATGLVTSGGTAEIKFSDNANVPSSDPPMVYNTGNTKGVKKILIGTVELARVGDRRYVRITQTTKGTIEQQSGSSGGGSSTSDPNLDTDSGCRVLTICINGKPYKTAFFTGPIVEVT
jgi:hypothetical protein